MAENKEKDSMDVHYEMTRADYDLALNLMKQLQQVPESARVVGDDNVPVTSIKSVNKSVKNPRGKEQLTTDVLKRMFGADWQNVCIYNNETKTLLTTVYNGAPVFWSPQSVSYSEKFKEQFQEAYPKFELVAQVTIQVSMNDYPGNGDWTSRSVRFDKDGYCANATLIIRNIETGRLQLINDNSWLGVAQYAVAFGGSPARSGASMLAELGVYVASFRNALFSGCKQR